MIDLTKGHDLITAVFARGDCLAVDDSLLQPRPISDRSRFAVGHSTASAKAEQPIPVRRQQPSGSN
jgi:hypothetical protein